MAFAFTLFVLWQTILVLLFIPHLYLLKLQDETALIWYAGKEQKQLRLSQVSRIIPGQRTVSLSATGITYYT